MDSALANLWDNGLCGQVGGDHHFPEGRGSGDAALAKKVCRGCDVVNECLEYALSATVRTGDGFEFFVDGIWGATTESERSRMRAGNSRPCNECDEPVWSGSRRHATCANGARIRKLQEITREVAA